MMARKLYIYFSSSQTIQNCNGICWKIICKFLEVFFFLCTALIEIEGVGGGSLKYKVCLWNSFQLRIWKSFGIACNAGIETLAATQKPFLHEVFQIFFSYSTSKEIPQQNGSVILLIEFFSPTMVFTANKLTFFSA